LNGDHERPALALDQVGDTKVLFLEPVLRVIISTTTSAKRIARSASATESFPAFPRSASAAASLQYRTPGNRAPAS